MKKDGKRKGGEKKGAKRHSMSYNNRIITVSFAFILYF